MEQESQEGGFWNDAQSAGKVLKQIERLKKEIGQWEHIKKETEALEDFFQEVDENDEEHKLFLQSSLNELEKLYKEYEKKTLYDGKYDQRGAIVSIHAGAGGVDAQDWAQMLLRMYLRYAERKGYKAELFDETKGAEAGIKSATLEMEGDWCYGNMKAEAGVHRLVRLSPFNADNLRQTSFALVEVLPAIEHEKELDIEPGDLRIDTFRASGAGGQHVNTTDSAVRITHIPTGLMVSCQSERSQLQNKQRAMNILKAKLLRLLEQQEKQQLSDIKGEHKSAAWGNQIRSYVLHPYQLVKDHRVDCETSDTKGVLDGDIDGFIEAYLRKNSSI